MIRRVLFRPVHCGREAGSAGGAEQAGPRMVRPHTGCIMLYPEIAAQWKLVRS